MKTKWLALVLGLGLLAFAFAPAASAQVATWYGPGVQNLNPHWHTTYTPYGPVNWYGNGPHDLRLNVQQYTPFGGVRSYSYTPLGPTVGYHGYPYGVGYGVGYGVPYRYGVYGYPYGVYTYPYGYIR